MRRFNFRNPLTPIGWFLVGEFALIAIIWHFCF